MSFGPLLPGGECSDVYPVFADGGCHGIESVDRVAGPELFVGVALVGNRPDVALDRGRRSLASACQVVLGPFELPLGHDEVLAGAAPLTTRSCGEATLGAGVDSSSIDGSSFGSAQGVALVDGGGCDLDQRRIRCGDGGGRLGPSRCATGRTLLGDEEVSLGVGQERREPLRHLAPLDRAGRRAWHRLSEGAALRRCGDVGPVDCEDGFEDVAGFGHVVAVGDDTERVGVAAAGGSDVEAAARSWPVR